MDPTVDTSYGDPGALDNRLTLDPNDSRWSGKVLEWQDGQEYSVSIRIRQVSPGEYEVVSMSGGEAPEPYAEEEEAPQTAEAAASTTQRGEMNPAVKALLGARQR